MAGKRPEDEIWASVEAAEEPPPPEDDGPQDDGAPPPAGEAKGNKPRTKSPNKVAEAILDEHEFISDRYGTVYRYTGRHWEEATDATLHALALKYDGARTTKSNRRREIAGFIRAFTHVDHKLGPEMKGEIPWARVAPHEVACRNGVVDVMTGQLRPHRSDDFLERVLPWDWDPGATSPFWLKALDLWFEDELDVRDALQDFFGYIVLPHAKFKKAIVIFGEPDSGKSRVPLAAKMLVGADYTCSLPVDAMEDPVKLAVIVGKGLNLITELPTDALIKDGGFKTLVSTEEPVLINPKYAPAHTYVPRTKHMIACNTLPRMTDKTEATFNRLLIIPFWNVIVGTAEEIDAEVFDAALLAEMPGVLAWAVEGAKRLVERHGKFVMPMRGQRVLGEFRDAENPFKQFLREKSVLDSQASVPLSVVAERFNRWNGQSKRMTVRQVGDMARRAGQTVKNVRQAARTYTCLIGFKLIDDDAPDLLHIASGDGRSREGEIEGRLNLIEDPAQALGGAPPPHPGDG